MPNFIVLFLRKTLYVTCYRNLGPVGFKLVFFIKKTDFSMVFKNWFLKKWDGLFRGWFLKTEIHLLLGGNDLSCPIYN
jgi:hypothetical protein